jgi:hypothetical protein
VAYKLTDPGPRHPSQVEQCERPWLPVDDEDWSAYLTDDEPPEVVFFCPDCAEREFGEAG